MTEATKVERAYYSVPACNLPYLLERIEKLNKRCARLGIPAIEVTYEVDYIAHRFKVIGGRVWVPEVQLEAYRERAKDLPDYQETGEVMEWYEVAVRGTAPKYDGWRFVATLEPLAQAGADTINLIMTVPGERCPTHYMKPEAVGRCDHCKAYRNRKQTFVVLHDDGTYRAVGRQCLKDFLGHKDPNTLARWAEMLAELGSIGTGSENEDWMGMGGWSTEPAYDLEYYLGWVAGAVRAKGWVSRGRARNDPNGPQATADRVAYILRPPLFTGKDGALRRAEWEALKEAYTPTDDDKALAAEAVEWALELDIEALMAEGDDSYLANVAAVARARVVTGKTEGLAASIVAAWARAKDKMLNEAARKARQAALPSEHVGAPKERMDLRVRVERIIPNEGLYGLTLITKLLVWDEARGAYANEAVWFATTEHKMEEGGEYLVKATVKAHEEYQGTAQTVVNRVKVLEALPGAALEAEKAAAERDLIPDWE